MRPYVNLGCGTRYRDDWINFDIQPAGPGVRRYDLSRGIPLPDQSVALVYHSHILEHIRRGDAEFFIRECFRVLEPGGVIRIATPDLERLCRDYLQSLAAMDAGAPHAAENADWMRIELIDQTVREKSGGEMLRVFQHDPIPHLDFIRGRIGAEADALLDGVRAPRFRRWPGFGRAFAVAVEIARRAVIAMIGGSRGLRAWDIGRFRLGGEVHQWLYDRHSLGELLHRCGFENVVVQSATSSRIPEWESFHLDAHADGRIVKSDSIFVEAVRPR